MKGPLTKAVKGAILIVFLYIAIIFVLFPIAAKASEIQETETICLALNIFFEARGEAYIEGKPIGQIAVGQVTLNRVYHRERWPDTICAVVFEPSYIASRPRACQFSWTCERDFNLDVSIDPLAWERSLQVARDLLAGKYHYDYTFGAKHYVECSITVPRSFDILYRSVRIGNHCFYVSDETRVYTASN